MNFNFNFDDFNFDFNFDFDNFGEEQEIQPIVLEYYEILNNYPYSFKDFCFKFLTIQNKAGQLMPFELNEWQLKAYDFILKKYERTKQIDVLIVKGRQGGMTTFSMAWLLYQMLALKCNVSFISNNFKNASNIYSMLERAICNFLIPLNITNKNAGHKIGIDNNLARFYTSEGDNIRGSTLLGLLNDELGERNDALELQALAKIEGMTHIKVGTPKGTGNNLYLMYLNLKENNKTDDILFLPWYELKEYEIHNSDSIITKETEEYLEKYNLGYLPLPKKMWLQSKIDELKQSTFNPFEILNQEYPPNLEVGFKATAENCFCEPSLINYAFENKTASISNIVILGVDVAGGGDKTIMCIRKGDYAEFIELKHNPQNPLDFQNKAEQICSYLLDNKNFLYKSINVDATGGMGLEFVAVLKEKLSSYRIRLDIIPVHFGSKTEQRINNYEVRRMGIKEYMYFELAKWLKTGNVKLQYIRTLQEELLATQIQTRDGIPTIIKKEDIKKKLGHSPDYADALALTFQPTQAKIPVTIYG